jgi:hypothetical protein
MLTAKGEWNFYPFRGTWLEQPAQTIQIFEAVRMEYIGVQNKRMEAMGKR